MRQLDVIHDALDELDPATASVYYLVRGIDPLDSTPAPRHSFAEIARLQGRSKNQIREMYRAADLHVLRHLAYAWRRAAGGTDPADLPLIDEAHPRLGYRRLLEASKKGTA